MDVVVKTVQMTLEPELVDEVDRAARRLGQTRSAFTRAALRAAIEKLHIRDLERRQREGYRRKPVARSEFDAWARHQAWPD